MNLQPTSGKLASFFNRTSLATDPSIPLHLPNMGKANCSIEEDLMVDSLLPSLVRESKYPDHGISSIHSLSQLGFPKFDGNQPRSWIIKCHEYFKLVPTLDDQQKVNLASVHLEGKAAMWFATLPLKNLDLSWEMLVELIFARFENIKEAIIFADFNKLKQQGDYAEYVHRFDELRARIVLFHIVDYSENYFIDTFVSGLDDELQYFVRMHGPTSVIEAIELGKNYYILPKVCSKMPNPGDCGFMRGLVSTTVRSTSLSTKLEFMLFTTAEMIIGCQQCVLYTIMKKEERDVYESTFGYQVEMLELIGEQREVQVPLIASSVASTTLEKNYTMIEWPPPQNLMQLTNS